MRSHMPNCISRKASRCGRDSGSTLLTALFAILVIGVLGLSLTGLGTRSIRASVDEREADDALLLADAGLTHARAIVYSIGVSSPQWDNVLQAGDGVGCTGDELAQVPVGATGFPPLADLIPQAGRAFGTGQYQLFICDDHAAESVAATPNTNPNDDANGRVKFRSVGVGTNGATVTVEAVIHLAGMPAVLVNGNLRVNGNPTIMGDAGIIHSNANLQIPGNPCTEQYAAASGSATTGGSPVTGPGCGGPAVLQSAQPPVPVPDLDPNSFAPLADYRLGNDGRVRNQAGTILGTNNWNDWSWDSGGRRWVAGSNIPAGTYFGEGNIEISGNPGTTASPIPLTLISVGWVKIGGNPVMVPDLSGPPAFSVLAGMDIEISGNASNPFLGIFYARHQAKFNGNPVIQGQLIVGMFGDTPYPAGGTNLVPLLSGAYMEISGNPSITYNGGTGLRNATMTSWRECRQNIAGAPCGPS